MTGPASRKRKAWDVADRELKSARADLIKYRDRDPKLAATVRARIDKWLDYRDAHGPEDLED